jgi:hypothetical protein
MLKNAFLRIGLIANLLLFLNATVFSYITYSIGETGKALFLAFASFLHFHFFITIALQINKLESENKK